MDSYRSGAFRSESTCRQSPALPEGSQEGSSLRLSPSFQGSPSILAAPWRAATYLQSLPSSSRNWSSCLSISSSSKDTGHTGLAAPPPSMTSPSRVRCATALLPEKPPSEILGALRLRDTFGGGGTMLQGTPRRKGWSLLQLPTASVQSSRCILVIS